MITDPKICKALAGEPFALPSRQMKWADEEHRGASKLCCPRGHLLKLAKSFTTKAAQRRAKEGAMMLAAYALYCPECKRVSVSSVTRRGIETYIERKLSKLGLLRTRDRMQSIGTKQEEGKEE